MRPRHKPGCTAFFHTPASGCPCFGLQTRPGWRPVVACRQSVGGFGFRLSPFPDGFRLRFAFGWLFSGGALPAAATARSALLRLCRFIPICCCTRPKDLMKKNHAYLFLPCRFRLCFVRRRRVPGHGHHPGPAAGDVGRRCLPYACQAALHDRPRRAGQGRPRGVDAACRGRILPRLLCRGLRRRHARTRTASYGRRRPRKLPSRRLPHKDHAHGPRCRRVVLRTPVARTTGRAPRPPHSGRHDRGRPALRLPGLHARRLAPFPRQGVRRTSARPHGALQAQPLPLAPDRRSRMAHRNQKNTPP